MNIKQLFFGTSILLSINTTLSQTNKIDIGFESAVGVAYITGSDRAKNDYKATYGIYTGFFAQFNFNKVLSIRTGIGAETKGFSAKLVLTDPYGNPAGKYRPRIGLNYLTVPVLLRATFGKTSPFFFNCGPYISYLLKQPSYLQKITFNQIVPYRKYDFGISTGVGFSIPIKTKAAISFEIRQNFGLYNINSTLFYSDDETINTNSTLALLSFSRKLGFRN